MITTTEDQFDVDYDLFSFAGRAALVGGGIYALDKSLKDDVFKRNPKNMGKMKNEYIKSVSSILTEDDVDAVPRQKTRGRSTQRSFFDDIDIKDRSLKTISISSVDDVGRIDLRKKLSGGYKGMSAGLIDELDALQQHIRETDSLSQFDHLRNRAGNNHISGKMRVTTDKKGNPVSVAIDSLAGTYNIPIVNEKGMINRKGNSYIARNQFNADGFKPGKVQGIDVTLSQAIRENHVSMLKGTSSFQEMKHQLDRALIFNGKAFNDLDVDRLSSEVIQNTRNSAMINVFKPLNRKAKKLVMKNAAIEGYGVASATNLADGIIRLKGDAVGTVDGLGETSNPNQLHRANTYYINKNGVRENVSNLNYAFLDKEKMSMFKKIAKEKYGIDFGDLAEEELIGNSKTLGQVADDARTIQIRGDQITDASDFVLNKLVANSGFSRKDFLEKIRSGGFAAFSPEQRLKMQSVGVNDYHNYLISQKNALKKKIRASQLASPYADGLRAERRQLIKERQSLRRARKVNRKAGRAFAPIDQDLARVDRRIRELNKKVKPSILRTQEYKEATSLRQKGKLTNESIQGMISELDSINSKLADSKFFGVSQDFQEDRMIKKATQNATINNIHVADDGTISFSLLNKRDVGQGVKNVDPTGEVKAIYKNVNQFVSNILKDVHVATGGVLDEATSKMFDEVHAVVNDSALKKEVTDRNLYGMLDSIRKKNQINSNSDVSRLLATFDASGKTDEDYENLFRRFNEISNGNIAGLAGTDYNGIYLKNKIVSFGAVASDLGAGGKGFVAERHIKLMLGSGMENFARSIVKRKSSPGMFRSYRDIDTVEKMLSGASKAGVIDFSNLDEGKFLNFMDELFPSQNVDGVSAVDSRRAFLKKIGKLDNTNTAYIPLGQTISGINKIPILTDENLAGFIGEQQGYAGDYKKYTEVDRLTKDIMREVRRGDADTGRLKTLIANYKVAFDQLKETTRSKIWKGKVDHSMVGQTASGSKALNDYADRFFNSKIKNSAPFVAAVSKKQYVQMFGQEAYDSFSSKNMSKTWAFAIREPVEGLSGLPVNVVPSDKFAGIKDLNDERIALVDGRKNSLLKMVFGDYDGDQLSLVAATDADSAAELRNLAMSNDANSVAYRNAQITKTKFSLKGLHSKSILSNSLADLRLSTYYAKDLEKGFVGIASNALRPLHEMNSRLNKSSEKFFRVEGMLHTIAENIIKGKAQSTEDLMSERSKKLLDAIVEGEEFMDASVGDRVKYMREFLDEVMLGGASGFANRLRAGERTGKIEQEITDALGGDQKRAMEILESDWFAKTTSDQALQDIIEVSGLSKNGSDELADAIDRHKVEVLDDSAQRLKVMAEEIQETIEETKKNLSGVGKNVAKYALAPAAALGLLGTVFGARSSIRSEVEFSDSESSHIKSTSAFQAPYERAQNIRKQRAQHMKPEVRGQASSGFSINKYASNHRVSDFRIQDDTNTFDYYDMQDRMKRGY